MVVMNVAVEGGLKEVEDELEDVETVFDMLLDVELGLGFGNDDDIVGMLLDVLDAVGMDVDMLLDEIAVEGLNMLVVVIVLPE